ncbi:hypothetical protein [Candidatus Poriferisocius sp.]|uniref:hypothetical protein n=1 Tax=Candidatus Poriferisocius sp. TaxID=3101276 RepID=UPI003B51A77B
MDENRISGTTNHDDFEGLNTHGRPDIYRNRSVVSAVGGPVVLQCVLHVFVGDTVLAGARHDVSRAKVVVHCSFANER